MFTIWIKPPRFEVRESSMFKEIKNVYIDGVYAASFGTAISGQWLLGVVMNRTLGMFDFEIYQPS